MQNWLQMSVIQSSGVIGKIEDESDITQDVDVLVWWRDVENEDMLVFLSRQFLANPAGSQQLNVCLVLMPYSVIHSVTTLYLRGTWCEVISKLSPDSLWIIVENVTNFTWPSSFLFWCDKKLYPPEFMVFCLVTLHLWGCIFKKFPDLRGLVFVDDGNIIGRISQVLMIISELKSGFKLDDNLDFNLDKTMFLVKCTTSRHTYERVHFFLQNDLHTSM